MADISNYFRERRNQFHKTAYQRIWRSNPFRSHISSREFPMEEGATPTIIKYTHELPTAYPSLTALGVSSGSGNTYCNPSTTTVKRGQTERTFSLGMASFQSDVFCLSDIKRAHQAAEAVTAFEKGMTEYATVWWADYLRLQNIAQVDQKVSTNSATTYNEVTSTAANFTGVGAIPTHELNWDHLTTMYFDILRRGLVDEYAVGTANGRPVIPIFLSNYYIKKLFHDDTQVREAVNYFDPQSNLKVLGYSEAVNGFLPVLDLFPIRFGHATTPLDAPDDLTVANMIYPTVNANATVGRTHQFNSNWLSTAFGGKAQFEVASILPKNVYELVYEPTAPESFSSLMGFKPQNYLGEPRFINQPTFQGDNDRGNLGYYLWDIRVGAKPINPDLAKAIVTLAKDS